MSRKDPPPSQLTCPLCGKLFSNAVSLPCCTTLSCRGCAIEKLLVRMKIIFIFYSFSF